MLARRALLAASLAAPALSVRAQPAWPGDRQVRVVVPLAPGGTADLLARLLAQKVTERAGGRAAVVVENRTGGGNAVGWQSVVRAAPDGNTLLMTDNSLAMAVPLNRDLGFDPRTDLAPVSRVADLAPVFCVPNNSPARTLPDLLAMARARPDELFYGSGGMGSATHLAAELLLDVAGVRMTHIGYRGMALATQDLAAGRVQFIVAALPTVAGMLRDGGRIRVIAVGSAARTPTLPDVPTAREAGLDYTLNFWFGLFAPRATDLALVAAMSDAFAGAGADPAVRARMEELGATAAMGTPEALGAEVTAEVALWSRIVRERGITL